MQMTADFDQLIAAALANEFSGWDFSHITGRWRKEEPSWDYRQRVTACLSQATALLDMGVVYYLRLRNLSVSEHLFTLEVNHVF
jgi:hypothetical protein